MTTRATRALILAVIFAAAAFPRPVQAQEPEGPVKIRLVLASEDSAATSSPALKDILPLLRRNLRYEAYRLLAEHEARPRDGLRIRLARGYAVVFEEVEGQLITVQVLHANRSVLQTRLRLQSGHPVILGGFPGNGRGILIVVFGQGAGR